MIGLVTCSALPELAADDQILKRELEALGVSTRVLVWDDPSVDWAAHAGLLIRSCWDYHTRLPEFLEWLARVESLGVPLWNPPSTIRANVSKDYLKRVPNIVPTRWVSQGERADLDAVLARRGWDEAVVKPLVSASAHLTRRVRRGDPSGPKALEEAARDHGAMIQPFLPEVTAEGELSLIFLAGAFSHAVLKTPASGDFRVQEEHGGRSASAVPQAEVIARAGAALAALGADWLYARVDGFRSGQGLLISEIELVEPSLYFTYGPAGARRLAEALAARP